MMKINTLSYINTIIFLNLLLKTSSCPLYSGIDLFKDPERLREFIIKTTTVPFLSKQFFVDKLFSKQFFVDQLAGFAKSLIVSSTIGFVAGIISTKFGKPFMINNAIKTALQEENKKPEVKENILKENEDISQFITAVSEKNFTFNSILLYGPPGTGKTTFARWLSQKIDATLYPFSEIAGALKLKSFMGNKVSPENLLTYLIKMIQIRKGSPLKKIIVLFDEFDLLYKKIKNFKNLISGLSENENYNNAIFMATTNYIENLPPPEHDRFEYKIYVDYSGTWIQEALSIAVKSYGYENAFAELVLDQFAQLHNALKKQGENFETEYTQGNLSYNIARLTRQHIIQDKDLYLPKLSLRLMQNAIKHAREKEVFNDLSEQDQAKIVAQEMYKELWFKAYLEPFPIPMSEVLQ